MPSNNTIMMTVRISKDLIRKAERIRKLLHSRKVPGTITTISEVIRLALHTLYGEYHSDIQEQGDRKRVPNLGTGKGVVHRVPANRRHAGEPSRNTQGT